MFALLHIDIANQSRGFMITLGSNCNSNIEVRNYMVFIIELQIKATAGGENYNYNYCSRKVVIIM